MKQFWFIGVTTGQSMIMRLFPIWAEVLGIQETRMHGVDLPPGVEGAKVRETIMELRDNPDVLGALVTTHKLAVWEEASDLFAEVDEHAKRLQEISCISKDRNGQLVGHAKDPITSGKAMGFILEENHWQTHPPAINLSTRRFYPVLAPVSKSCPRLKGRSSTRYSPVRHCTRHRSDFLVRLACIRHAASVRSEPGSNSQVLILLLLIDSFLI